MGESEFADHLSQGGGLFYFILFYYILWYWRVSGEQDSAKKTLARSPQTWGEGLCFHGKQPGYPWDLHFPFSMLCSSLWHQIPPLDNFLFFIYCPFICCHPPQAALTARGTNCNLIVFLSEVKSRDHNICLCPLRSCKARLTFKGKRNYFDLVLGLERAEGNHDDGEPQTSKK